MVRLALYKSSSKPTAISLSKAKISHFCDSFLNYLYDSQFHLVRTAELPTPYLTQSVHNSRSLGKTCVEISSLQAIVESNPG